MIIFFKLFSYLIDLGIKTSPLGNAIATSNTILCLLKNLNDLSF